MCGQRIRSRINYKVGFSTMKPGDTPSAILFARVETCSRGTSNKIAFLEKPMRRRSRVSWSIATVASALRIFECVHRASHTWHPSRMCHCFIRQGATRSRKLLLNASTHGSAFNDKVISELRANRGTCSPQPPACRPNNAHIRKLTVHIELRGAVCQARYHSTTTCHGVGRWQPGIAGRTFKTSSCPEKQLRPIGKRCRFLDRQAGSNHGPSGGLEVLIYSKSYYFAKPRPRCPGPRNGPRFRPVFLRTRSTVRGAATLQFAIIPCHFYAQPSSTE